MNPEPLRILLVADDPEQIRRTGQGLRRQGGEGVVLEGADSLATARRRVASASYDVALVDLALGEGPGVDTLADFRAIAPGLPIVALARPAEADDLPDSLAAGAADCLSADALDCAGLVDRLAAAAVRARVGGEAARRLAWTGAALEAAADLLWHWTPGGGVWLSAADPGAWGLAGNEMSVTPDEARDRVHPDDRERAVRRLAEALEGEGPLRIEARLKLGSGGYRWCECRGRVSRNAAGVLEQVAGVVTDVQRRHNSLRDLERARRQLRAVLDSDPVPQAIVNSSGFVVDCNRAWLELDDEDCHAGVRFGPGMGFLAGEAESEGDTGSWLSPEELSRGLRQVLGGVIGQFSCEYGTGERRWRIRLFPLLNPGIAGAVVRHEDVSAERRAVADTSSRLAGLEAALAAVPGPWFRLAPDFTVEEAGPSALSLCPRDPVGRDVLKALPRADADAVAAALAAAGRGEAPGWADAASRQPGVARRWGAKAIPAGEGAGGFFLFATDIADLVAEETGLETARDAALACPVGIALVEGKGARATLRWANPAFAAISGQAAEALEGRALADHLAGAGRWDEAELERALAEPASGGRVTVHRYDGAAWELAFAYAGRHTCIAAADVADRERAAAALGDLRRRLQGVLRGSGDGAWEWDEATGQGWLSPRALEILGLPPEAAEEGFDAAIRRVHRADRSALRDALRDAARRAGRVESEVRLEGAEGAWIEVRGEAARGARLVSGTLRDVGEARRAREVLEDRDRRAMLALRGAGLGTWGWSSRTGRVRADAAARRLHGDPGEAGLVGLRAWLARVAPADRRRVLEAVARLPADGRLVIEYGLAGSDRVVAVEGQVLASDAGAPRRADGVCRDVTGLRDDRDGAAREALEQAAREAAAELAAQVAARESAEAAAAQGAREAAESAAKARAMAGVAAAAGREFGNLLGVVLGSLELLETELAGDAGASRRIGAAVAAARQGGTIAGRLLDAAAEADGEPSPAISSPDPGIPEPARHSILVVEPDAGLRSTAAELLASLGWRVRSVADADEALEALAREPVDVLFTELAPGGALDGDALASRAVALVAGLGVVFCASRSVGGQVHGHPVVTKPYGRRDLASVLKQVLED